MQNYNLQIANFIHKVLNEQLLQYARIIRTLTMGNINVILVSNIER